MYADYVMYIMIADIFAIMAFVIFNLVKRKTALIHRLFMGLAGAFVIWQIAIIAMKFAEPDDERTLFLLDAVSNIGTALTPVMTLLIALTFTQNLVRLPKRYLLFCIVPVISIVMIFTNNYHHLYYKVFSVYADRIVFGPYMLFSGGYGYVCLIAAMGVTLRFGLSSAQRVYMKQALVFSVGILIPLIVNVIATLRIAILSIAATPLAFVATIGCFGYGIYYLDLLNIKPLALQRVLDSISDGYIVLGGDGLIISFNRPFGEVFAPLFALKTGARLRDAVEPGETDNQGILYNLITSVDSCGRSRGAIFYEQAVLSDEGKHYFIVEVSPLIVNENVGGYIAMFKDVTRLREAMQREQESLSRAMERERLASLGQMIGGIAHNLKTPIMSVAGSVGVLGKLADEYAASIGDPEVTQEDHREIARDMNGWLQKIQECCAYMSDIITTVKGLAANMSTSESGEFTVDEVCKRVLLLTQHELKRGNCALRFISELPPGIQIEGDINNLVQVVNNLVSNAIDAMQDMGGGEIVVSARMEGGDVLLTVRDHGPGVPEAAREKLFREMFTSKGARGTGLGLYISSVLMRGKFGGGIQLDDCAEGASFTLRIPLDTDAREED